jgi:hypothetical protein
MGSGPESMRVEIHSLERPGKDNRLDSKEFRMAKRGQNKRESSPGRDTSNCIEILKIWKNHIGHSPPTSGTTREP